LFFGYIANAYQKDIGIELIFLYQILFNPNTFWSLIILFAIVFIVALRENFFEYAIRNSIWFIPAIMIMSWFWYWFNFGFDITIIFIYFIKIEGYITILTLICINFLAAFSASVIKEKRKKIRQQQKLIITEKSVN
jgi:hypothetical protein